MDRVPHPTNLIKETVAQLENTTKLDNALRFYGACAVQTALQKSQFLVNIWPQSTQKNQRIPMFDSPRNSEWYIPTPVIDGTLTILIQKLYQLLISCDIFASQLRCWFMSWGPSPYRRFGWVWRAMFHQFGNMERRPYHPARPPRCILAMQIRGQGARHLLKIWTSYNQKRCIETNHGDVDLILASPDSPGNKLSEIYSILYIVSFFFCGFLFPAADSLVMTLGESKNERIMIFEQSLSSVVREASEPKEFHLPKERSN